MAICARADISFEIVQCHIADTDCCVYHLILVLSMVRALIALCLPIHLTVYQRRPLVNETVAGHFGAKRLRSEHIVLMMLSSNLIGVVCARSLHYQVRFDVIVLIICIF